MPVLEPNWSALKPKPVVPPRHGELYIIYQSLRAHQQMAHCVQRQLRCYTNTSRIWVQTRVYDLRAVMFEDANSFGTASVELQMRAAIVSLYSSSKLGPRRFEGLRGVLGAVQRAGPGTVWWYREICCFCICSPSVCVQWAFVFCLVPWPLWGCYGCEHSHLLICSTNLAITGIFFIFTRNA